VCTIADLSNCCCLQWSIGSLQSSGVLIYLLSSLICICLNLTKMDKWCELLAVMIISLSLAGLDGCHHLVGYPSPPFEPIWVMITVHGLLIWAGSVVEVTLTAIHCCLGSSHPCWLAMA
jgi:hypothetical protein